MSTKTFSSYGDVKLTLHKECKTCMFDSTIAKIYEDGECEYCKLQTQLRESSTPDKWDKILSEVREKGKKRKYDILVGISGGEDSSIMLRKIVQDWGLRPLVIHFDNWWNVPEANNNIEVLVKNLNVDFIRYFTNKGQYDDINYALLSAGLQDADINNDCAMARYMDMTCKFYDIKYIANGHNFRTEGSSPAAWSRIDSKYLASVYEKQTGKKLVNYPALTFWHQVVAGIKGIRQVRPYHFVEINREEELQKLFAIGWQQYTAKHCENIYTWFVGGYLLPKKFNINKQLTYLSAAIREGTITKEQAKEWLQVKHEFDLNLLGVDKDKIMNLVDSSPIGNRNSYDKFDFKAWKPLVWILTKMGVFPRTFMAKYCK